MGETLGVDWEVFETEGEGDKVPTPPLGELKVDTVGETTPVRLALRDPSPGVPLFTLESLALLLPEMLGLKEVEREGRRDKDPLAEVAMVTVGEGVGVNKGRERVGVCEEERVGALEVEEVGEARGEEVIVFVGEKTGLGVPPRSAGEEDNWLEGEVEAVAAVFKLSVGEKELDAVMVFLVVMVGKKGETVDKSDLDIFSEGVSSGEFVASMGGGEGVGNKGVPESCSDTDALGLPLSVPLADEEAVPGRTLGVPEARGEEVDREEGDETMEPVGRAVKVGCLGVPLRALESEGDWEAEGVAVDDPSGFVAEAQEVGVGKGDPVPVGDKGETFDEAETVEQEVGVRVSIGVWEEDLLPPPPPSAPPPKVLLGDPEAVAAVEGVSMEGVGKLVGDTLEVKVTEAVPEELGERVPPPPPIVELGEEELVNPEGVGERVAPIGGEGEAAPLLVPLPLKDGTHVCVPAKEMVVVTTGEALEEGVREGLEEEEGVEEGSPEVEGGKVVEGVALGLALTREVKEVSGEVEGGLLFPFEALGEGVGVGERVEPWFTTPPLPRPPALAVP